MFVIKPLIYKGEEEENLNNRFTEMKQFFETTSDKFMSDQKSWTLQQEENFTEINREIHTLRENFETKMKENKFKIESLETQMKEQKDLLLRIH